MSQPIEPEDLAGRIGDMLAAVRRAMRSGRQLGDLPPRHEAALAWLRRKGRLTTAQLARYEQITPQSMGVVVAELVEKGLVVKAKDPNDGRRELLVVTEAGIEAVAQTDESRHADLVRLLATKLSDDERELVARGLDVLMKIEEESK
ncbi:MarR family winged helix-turn-helix transcriptional regulator [Gryllotalpicola protaetiae]|uniref:MarR family transcriptional regulator n=1 Tax=Gryllotalpicola protaetiae TaxID=2419771 RepID=A0A387BQZ8_9MICO|nr:MarR family transcriptional regulator [Gryllotalpicola protaetiae]AYG03499.1 MarR family transcriptional regulator [Gryllotalpicola protaetiae]